MSELTENKGPKHEIEYSLSWTKNMGNFESLKVNLGLTLEGYGNPYPTLERVRNFVENELGKAVEQVSESIEG